MSRVESVVWFALTLVLCFEPCWSLCGIAGSTCSNDLDCTGLDGGVCKVGVCDCPPGYYSIPGEYYCAKIKIGSPCNPVDAVDVCPAAVTGGVCDRDYGYCRCSPGYRNVVTDTTNLCVSASVVSDECSQCNATGGACYVPSGRMNIDGAIDIRMQCGCPEYYLSSGLSLGCDTKYSYTGGVCGGSSSITCVDANAQCAYAGDLSHGYFCLCKLGYVAVPRPYDPKYADCYRIVNKVLDAQCQSCDDNGGVCYSKDSIHGGCLCPPTRSTSGSTPVNYCDVNHFVVTCNSTVSPTVCYSASGNAMHQHILTRLQQGIARLYVLGFSDNLDCYFTNTTVDGDFCLTLQPDNSCNTYTQTTSRFVSFSNWFVLQRNARFLSSNDYNFHAFCTYDTMARVSTGIVEVADKQIVASEGSKIRPSLLMGVYDRFGDNIQMEGVILGDEIMLKIRYIDTKGIYTALRAEVCVVSNLLSLKHPQVQTVLFIMNSCPADNCLLPTATNFYPEGNIIRTGYFPAPKFDRTDYIFFHCAVRVCIAASQCSPLDCSSRQKRSADLIRVGSVELPFSVHDLVPHSLNKRSTDASMFDVSRAMESNELVHQTVAIKVRNPEPSKEHYVEEQPHQRYLDPERKERYNAPEVSDLELPQERYIEELKERYLAPEATKQKTARTSADHSYVDVSAAEHSSINQFDDSTRNQRQPSQVGVNNVVLLLSVLGASVVTLLIVALLVYFCYVLPRRSVVQIKTKKSDMS